MRFTDVLIVIGKKLGAQLAVLGPLTFLVAVGLSAHTAVPPFRYMMPDEKNESRIAAYIVPVRMTALLNLDTSKEVRTPGPIRDAAKVWLDLYHDGRLQPLKSTESTDTSRDGAKNQINTAKVRLAYAMIRVGDTEFKRGNLAQASTDWMDALEISEIMKYSDLISVTTPHSVERHALDRLFKVSTMLSEPDRGKLIGRLVAWRSEYRPLSQLLFVEKFLYMENCAFLGLPLPTARDYSKFVTLANMMERPFMGEDKHRIRDMMSTITGELPVIFSHARVAWQHETELESFASQIIAKLGTKSTVALAVNMPTIPVQMAMAHL